MMKNKMRKNRILGLLLSSVMLLTMLAIPVYAEETLPAPVHDDFSSYTTETVQAAYTNHAVQIENKQLNKQLKLKAGSAYALKDFTNNPINKGKIKVSTTITPTDTSMLGAVMNNDQLIASHMYPLVYFYNQKAYFYKTVDPDNEASSNDNKLADVTANTEYTIEVTIDMDAKTMNVDMKKSDGTAIGNKEGINIEKCWPGELTTSIKAIGFRIRSGDNPMYAKDLHIEYVQGVTATPLLLPVNDTFSTFADKAALNAAYGVVGGVELDSYGVKIDQNGGRLYKDFTTNPITKGKIKVAATMKPTSNSVLGFINDANKIWPTRACPIVYFRETSAYVFNLATKDDMKLGDFTTNTEYTIEATIDMDAKKMNVDMKDSNGNSVGNKEGIDITKFNESDITSIVAIGFGNRGEDTSVTDKSYAKDLRIEYVQTGKPSLTDAGVKFYVGNTEISKDKLSTKLNKIVLDFGDVMNPESFTNNEVTLTKKDTGELIKVNASITGSIYTIEIPSKLNVSTAYVLNVSKDVKNAVGIAMNTAYNMEFTVKSGELDASIALKDSDGTTITNLSQLKDKKEISTNISFENTTGKEVTAILLYGYYAGDKLKKVSVSPITFDASATSGTATQNYTLESLDGVTKVKVMLWNGFSEIKPLAEFVELN